MRHLLLCLVFFPVLVNGQHLAMFDSLQHSYSDTIYFESGSWEITPVADSVLHSFPLPQRESDRLYLTAHTDAIGSVAYNENLATQRAQSAAAVLQERGWLPEGMVQQTFGERRPSRENNTDSNRQKNRRVTLDYFIEIPFQTISGRVIDPATDEGVPAQIRVHGRSFSDTLQATDDGRFSIALPVDSVVGFDVYASGYFYQSEYKKIKAEPMAPLEIKLPKAEAGQSMDIPNLYFYGNQDILLPRSIPERPKIQRFLEMNPTIKVEIAGHVNQPNQPPVTEDTFEWRLSVRRAQAIYNWLIEQGIPEEQITPQGYGNHYMRYPHATSEQQMSLNRRVEIRVLKQ